MRTGACIRVCFIAGTLARGGAERQLYYQVRFLAARGAAVEVVTFGEGEYWEAPIAALGVPIHSLVRARRPLTRLALLWRHLLRTKPDFVQSVHFHTNLYAVAAGRLAGARDYGAVQSDVVRELSLSGWFRGPSLRLPRRILANNRRAIATARRLGVAPDKLTLLPNVVDTTRFSPAGRRPAGPFTIACVGRLVPEKRFDRVLRVAALVRAHLESNLRVLIAGDGPERRSLEHQARALALHPGTVEFLGEQDEPERVYRDADAFLLVSDHEGSPNVVLEAMASGLPVVSEAVNGIRELITDNETGFVTSRFDPQETAAKLVRLAGDPDTRSRIGVKACRWVERERSLAQLERFLAPLYGLPVPGSARQPATSLNNDSHKG